MALIQTKALRKVIGAVKDQTTISIAKVALHHADLEVAIVKATGHDELPSAEKHVQDILYLTSCSRECVQTAISCLHRRLSKTKDWMVAIKALILCHRLLRDGDPSIERELVLSRRRGKVLLTKVCDTFCDEYYSSGQQFQSSEFSAFVSSYGLYLEERLDSSVPSFSDPQQPNEPLAGDGASVNHDLNQYTSHRKSTCGRHRKKPVRKMKPYELMEKFPSFLRLLERILSCRPSGSASHNNLVLSAIRPILLDSFLLYKDIKDGMSILLDGFFDMDQCDCTNAFDVFSKIAKKLDELAAFYSYCKTLGIPPPIEYPNVEKISEELLETMEASLKLRADSSARSGNSKRVKNRPQARSVRFKDQLIVEDNQEKHVKEVLPLPSPSTIPGGEEISRYAPSCASLSSKELETLPQGSASNGGGIVYLIDMDVVPPSERCESDLTVALFDGITNETKVNTSWETFSSCNLNIDGKKNQGTMATSESCDYSFSLSEPAAKVNVPSWEAFSDGLVTMDYERKREGNAGSEWELALVESETADLSTSPAMESLANGLNLLLLDSSCGQGNDQSKEAVPNAFPPSFLSSTPFVPGAGSGMGNYHPFVNTPPAPYLQMPESAATQQLQMQSQQQWYPYQQQPPMNVYSSYNNPFLLNPYPSTVEPVHYYGTNSFYP
jgi:hypothetical protein